MLDPLGRSQRPAYKRFTALRAMGQLKPLTLAAEDHRVVANRVAGTERQNCDLIGWPHTGNALPSEGRVVTKIGSAGFSDCSAKRQRRSWFGSTRHARRASAHQPAIAQHASD